MERNVSCRNTKAAISYVRRHHPDILDTLLDDLDPFFDDVDNVHEYFKDEHNWISQHVYIKIIEKIKKCSDNPEVAREIGNESITYRDFGYVENIFIKAFGHPYLSILRAPAINAKFNKTKTVEIIESGWSHAILRLRWFDGLGTTKDVCLYNQGIYEAIPTLWGLPMAKVVETKCYFEGDEYCEYYCEWAKKSFLGLIFGFFSRRKEILKASLDELEREKTLLEEKYREIEHLNIELKKKVDQLTSLDACSKATASILDIDRLLDVVMSLIVNIMQFDRALIFLVNDDSKCLVPVKSIGGSPHAIDDLKGYSIPLFRTQNILARVVNSGIGQIITDVGSSYLKKDNMILQKFNPKSFVAVPLITRNKVIGLMAAERNRGLDDFTTNDLDFVMNFCNQIAISLENAELLDNMKESFVSSILSLTTALEAKDPYTRGHSNRVAIYSTIIARKMGLDNDKVEAIRLMALMHDVGKIGIPDQIINKTGRLTDDEFKLVKRHPLVSMKIIEPLLGNKPELTSIKYHHERYDGLGYPEGLTGRGIPEEARILAVADAFDAMTTSRPYRVALTKQDAIQEIVTNSGFQFCPESADIFIDAVTGFTDDLFTMINVYDGENQKK